MPATASYFGFTGKIGPANPASHKLRSTVAPMLCGFSEAPISATDLGANKYSRFLMVI